MRFSKKTTDTYLKEKWEELWVLLSSYGIRNCSLTALAPTSNSSRLVGASYSIEPLFDVNDSFESKRILTKELLKRGYSSNETENIIQNNSFRNIESIKDYFLTKKDIFYIDELLIMSEIQNQIDEAISKTITVPTNYKYDQIKEIIINCFKYGLKGVAIHRDKGEPA